MHIQPIAVLACCAAVQAAAIERQVLHARQANSTTPYSIPEGSGESAARESAIAVKRQTFLYGPDPDGTKVYFPSGSLGTSYVDADIEAFEPEGSGHNLAADADAAKAEALILQAGGISTLADYNLLYSPGLWSVSVGNLFDAGMQTNYTQDLLFSMERLSINPYSLRRLNPLKDKLPFTVPSSTMQLLAGLELELLFLSGSLFYIDYSDQLSLPTIAGRYAAGCEALFYIHPVTEEFLPLAIRTNAPGSNGLVYTPADEPNDWLLAKIAFNQNDHWFMSFYHFAATHFKAEIVYEAAIRTLSDDHPVLGLLQRNMYQAFALRPAAATILLAPGTGIDHIFASSGSTAAQSTQNYYSLGAGNFQSNYLETLFTARGLVNCNYGPPLATFPFWEDASAIVDEHRTFMTAAVNAFYSSDRAVAADPELQAWLLEAGPAQIMDFPTGPLTKSALVEMLVHMAYLTSVEHHVLNTNDPVATGGQLPFHPAALYAPLPTAKGVTDIMPFLPNTTQALAQLLFWSSFSRPEFENSPNTLANMWSEASLLARMPAAVSAAATAFQNAMQSLSNTVRQRAFNKQGLSQGMPFVWKALDPQTIPFFLAI